MVGARILIVEDESIVAEDIKECLNSSGYSVIGQALTGEDALHKVRDLNPDLVLMDIVLAGKLSGTQTAAKISKSFDIPVVYLTAYADDDTIESAKVTGPYGYIVKPYDERDLNRTVEMALYSHRMQKQLKESEERYRVLVENSLLGVAIIQDKRFAFVNSSFCDMLGYKSEILKKLTFDQIKKLIYRQDRNNTWNIIDNALAGDKSISSLSVRVVRRDREIRWFDLTINVIDSGKKSAVHLIAMDTTERKRLEEQLYHSQKMESMGQLSAGVAHQLNTPLAVISTRLQILEDDIQKAGDIEYLEDVRKVLESSDKMSAIISRLLTFSRQSEDVKETTDINHLLQEILLFVEVNARENEVKLKNDFSENLPNIPVFRNKLEQVFLNIIINAFDAMPKGGVLTVQTDRVRRNNISYIAIYFTDTGTGMLKKVKENLFEPFFTTKPAGKGTGLGMFVSYGIVKEHTGEILVQSKQGNGTQIEIYLPVED